MSFSLLGAVLLVMFQNCGEDGGDFNPSLQEENYAKTQLPFAFDFDIDQIGYMSCNGSSVDVDSKLFTYKAGAFGDDAGVYLRDGYKATASGAGFNGKKMADALDISDRNSLAGLVLAIRSSANLQATSGQSASTISGLAYDRDLNLSLSQTSIAEELVNALPGKKLNTFTLPGLNDNRSVDAQISFSVNETDTNLLRNRISSNEFMLALTYGVQSGENDQFPGQRARSPYDPRGLITEAGSYVFGKGYNFEFYQYDPFRTGSQSRAITRVSRNTNLEDRSNLGEDWVCPDDEKYIIVRPGDALRGYSSGGTIGKKNETGAVIMPNPAYQFSIGGGGTANIPNGATYLENVVCPMFPDDVPANSITASKWKRARNMLLHKDWHIFRGVENGLAYNCIVPKGGESCYGEANQNTNPSIVVQYLRNETYPGYPDATRPTLETNCGSGTQKFCPHILSICYKR